MSDTSITTLWQDAAVTRRYRTAVSLHSHTSHSIEPLDFLRRARSSPLANRLLNRVERNLSRQIGRPFLFEDARWTPPLTPRAAFQLESSQIEALDLQPLVSLTDHDSVEAPLLLRLTPDSQRVPVSFEWTVPFETAEFHIGVHNLPYHSAPQIFHALQSYTQRPCVDRLGELLSWVQELPDVLLVFNHPLWDERGLGERRHRNLVDLFLIRHGRFLHAFELNGLRSFTENQAVEQMAQRWRLPVISGGDRHGREPNANLNLTQAESFPEFVAEVRRKRHSHVLFLPQYREPHALRVMQTVLDVFLHGDTEGAQGTPWDDRVLYPDVQGHLRTFDQYFKRQPWWMKQTRRVARLLQNQTVRLALRLALDDESRVRL